MNEIAGSSRSAGTRGLRLKRCLASLATGGPVVYVDSGSTDGSDAVRARESGADVIELDMSIPFTAARARNAGFSAAAENRCRHRRLCNL